MSAVRALVRVSTVLIRCRRKDVRLYSNGFVVKSDYPSLSVPDLTVDEFVFGNIERWPDKPALVCIETGRILTFSQVQTSSERLAQALRVKLGLNAGDIVAVVLPNVPEYCVTLLACFKAGIVVTTINPIYTSDEIRKQLIDSGAKLVFTLPDTWSTVDVARSTLNRDIPIVITKGQNGESGPRGAIHFEELCAYNGRTMKLDSRSAEDLVLLPYSSGTTGLPKGVCLTQRNIVANLCQMQTDRIRLNQDTTGDYQDVIPVVLPMYHLYALMIIFLNMFSMGCQLVILPRYHPEKFLDLLDRYRPTILHAVPPIIHFLNIEDKAKKSHLERVRHILSAAAPLSAEDTERFYKKYNHGVQILQAYGLTETSPLSHSQRIDVSPMLGGSGWVLANTECKVVSLEEPRDLGPGEPGEVYIRGPQVMQGYHNNEPATRDTINDEGWLKTGDIGYYDGDGQFFITDRLKELIKVKGFQVAPAELEAVLRDHPDIVDAAVIGIKDPSRGEMPKAFVVPRPNSRLRTSQVQEYVSSKVAKYKRLTGGVQFIDAVPRNPSGKILRRSLKNL